MKILVIQLTRPGDIFCTWPALSSLRRQYPNAEIHFLVRKKFYQAASDFFVVDHFWQLDTEKIFSPLIFDPQATEKAHYALSSFLNELRLENFDQIINLSFSPSSSFITHLLATQNTVVKGYSRTSDFYLYIPDEASRYFKSQVGVEQANRLHVVDLFGMVCQTEIKDTDLKLYRRGNKNDIIACHLGASQKQKTWPKESWAELIKLLLEANKKVVLVGARGDLEASNYVFEKLNSPNITNLVGKTSFKELAKVLSSAEWFIGCDSGPMHVASLTGCKTLNLSVGQVNFWETGPTTPGSLVLKAQNPQNLTAQEVFMSLFKKNPNAFLCDGQKMVRFDDQADAPSGGWSTVVWTHFGGPTPSFSQLDKEFLAQIEEVCDLAQEEIKKILNNQTANINILTQLEEVLNTVGAVNPKLSPLINYFNTEKANILPGTQEQVATQTYQCYAWLRDTAKKGCLQNDDQLLQDR